MSGKLKSPATSRLLAELLLHMLLAKLMDSQISRLIPQSERGGGKRIRL
jgi:hypothetical protein